MPVTRGVPLQYLRVADQALKEWERHLLELPSSTSAAPKKVLQARGELCGLVAQNGWP